MVRVALVDPLVAHPGLIRDPHGKPRCMEEMDNLLWAPGLRLQPISITCGAHMEMSAILFKCASAGHSLLSFIALKCNQCARDQSSFALQDSVR